MSAKPRFKQAHWGHTFYWGESRGEKQESYMEFLEREFPKGWRVIEVQRLEDNMMSPPGVIVTAQWEGEGE